MVFQYINLPSPTEIQYAIADELQYRESDLILNGFRGVAKSTITGIYVAGFTSPEGTYEYNMNLSNRRARTFADYIARNCRIDPDMMSVEWSGEDWAGLKEALAGSGFYKKAIVAGIIDT